jgi:hypothetical protein
MRDDALTDNQVQLTPMHLAGEATGLDRGRLGYTWVKSHPLERAPMIRDDGSIVGQTAGGGRIFLAVT